MYLDFRKHKNILLFSTFFSFSVLSWISISTWRTFSITPVMKGHACRDLRYNNPVTLQFPVFVHWTGGRKKGFCWKNFLPLLVDFFFQTRALLMKIWTPHLSGPCTQFCFWMHLELVSTMCCAFCIIATCTCLIRDIPDAAAHLLFLLLLILLAEAVVIKQVLDLSQARCWDPPRYGRYGKN